jgi:5-oxopent-3-ene-1,2,5-tricarboxylate decarboxylase/2-hydroxyhepta-2,4-diene-1,7-dioate isomerase
VKYGRVAYGGAVHHCTPTPDDRVRLEDGRVVDDSAVVWLPPLVPRTVFAVGLNYADHASELSLGTQQEPLVFLKGRGTLAGHRATTRRPAGVAFMHYECELAAVIGRTARNVHRDQALDYVRGYTVANDYAIRDYLENYYRPNLRVKNRDQATLLGPWLVDAVDVGNPSGLDLRTLVNGTVTQTGNTRDMIFGVARLIEHLSSLMTLSPDDVILTGTPAGVVNVDVGDEVVTEIDGIGRLLGYVVSDPAPATPAVGG